MAQLDRGGHLGMLAHQGVADVFQYLVLNPLLLQQRKHHFPARREIGVGQHDAESGPGEILDRLDLLRIPFLDHQHGCQETHLHVAQQGVGIPRVLLIRRMRDKQVAHGLQLDLWQMVL